ncbi:MAG: alpha/beta hydrolase [Spirochaetota bacterium]
MKIEKIPADTKVTTLGMPRYYEGDNGKAVLVLHGFTGLADEMDYLAQRLNRAGFTVSVPRLPGHGSNGKDFMQSGWRDWLRCAIDAYLELKTRFETVYVSGLSMGGILTLLLASHFPIERIALAAPAVINLNKMIYLSPILRFFMRRSFVGHAEESDDPERQLISNEYWSYRFGHQIYGLLRLQLMARRRLSKLRAASLILVSHSDDAVPVEVADLIEKRSSARSIRRIEFERSSHIIVNDTDREPAADEIVAWFTGNS